MFRRTFLWRLVDPKDAAALERLGDMLWEWVNETHQFGSREGEVVVDELSAAAQDLERLQRYLEEVAAQRLGGGLSRESLQLADKAVRWESTVGMLAAEIAAAVAAHGTPSPNA
jgi:hypothetical protein